MPDKEKPSTFRLLCLDPDPDFIAYFSASTDSIDISIEACSHWPEGRKNISAASYDAFLIDHELDLIEEVRSTGAATPLIILSEQYRDEDSFRYLKETQKISYVLEKPISPPQIRELCNYLIKGDISLSAQTFQKDARLQALKDRYDKNICETIIHLTRLVRSLQKHPNKDTLEALHKDVHNISGSAGTYGYSMVSEMCGGLDAAIRDKLAFETPIEDDWLHSLDMFLNQIKFYFQVPATHSDRPHGT